MNGLGTAIKDLNNGILKSSETTTSFDGKMTVSSYSGLIPEMPPMGLQGTIKVTIASGT